MNLLTITFISLCVSSFFGAILFLGFTFRFKLYYPLALVLLHVSTITVTFIIFSIVIGRKIMSISHLYALDVFTAFLLVTYFLFFCTLGSGLFFFFKYDLKRRQLKMKLISAHLMMAAMTFIFFISSMALSSSKQVSTSKDHSSSSWYIIHRHHITQSHYSNH